MGFFLRQEYWSGLPFPPPGNLPNLGIEPAHTVFPALHVDSLPAEQSLLVNHQLVPVLGYHQVVQGDAEEQGLWSLIHLHLNPWSTGWVTLSIVT